MNKIKKDDKYTTCNCCQNTIPISAALTSEGMDYVYYFCGTNCFEKWRKQQNENSGK